MDDSTKVSYPQRIDRLNTSRSILEEMTPPMLEIHSPYSHSLPITLLRIEDVNRRYVQCPNAVLQRWELLRSLKKKKVLQPVPFRDYVVYTIDGKSLFGPEWDNWTAETSSSSDNNTPRRLQAEVELFVIRKSSYDEKLSERDQENCRTPSPDIDTPPPTSPVADATDQNVCAPSLPNIATPENSAVRRRKRQPSFDESDRERQGSPLQKEDAEQDIIIGSEDQKVDAQSCIVVRVSRKLYLYLIKPPFIALSSTSDDVFLAKDLDFCLSFLQSWILGIDICILGSAWGAFALTSTSKNALLRTLVQLSASFAFFGIVFGLLLYYNIGLKKDLFVQWIDQDKSNQRNESRASLWNPIIMLNLPLAWTGWAVVNTVLFVLSYAWNGDASSNPSVTKYVSGAFTNLVILWSIVYVIMIRRELSKCYHPVLPLPASN